MTRTALVVLVGAMLALTGCTAPPTSLPTGPGSAPTATSPTAPPTTTAAPASAVAAPTAVTIPGIGATSTLIPTGLLNDGSLEVPDVATPEQAAWWTGSPRPGELGPAVLLGHVDGDGRPGVFHQLHRLAPGDEVLVDRADGGRARFVVDRALTVPKATFDDPEADVVADVYGDVVRPELRLITCGGPFDRAARSYRDQVVVFAHLENP